MLNSWYNKRKVKSASQELIKTVKYILKKHDSSLEPSLSLLANDKVNKLQETLANGSEKEIDLQYFSLKSLIDKDLKPYTKSKLRQNVEAILIALALALLIRTFVVQPFKIPSGSMIPTLLVGDHLLVNKFVYGTKIPFINKVVFPLEDINRGDVIVFKFPNDAGPKKGVHYIKRVVGLPGDKIDLQRRDILINGEKIPQDYLESFEYSEENVLTSTDRYIQTFDDKKIDVIYRKGLLSTAKGKFNYPITVPEGNVFVLGDNRDNSYDSRFWGFVPISNISGKAFAIHWSWDLKNKDFFDKVRWKRIFSRIN